MFKRFNVSEDVSARTTLRSSAVRAVKTALCEQYPSIAPYIDDVIPKKGDVLEGKGKDKLVFLLVDNEPLLFRHRDGPYFPTLRLLHKYPCMMARIQVDAGAIRFVLGGADVMAPGILSPDGAIPQELPADAPVAVYACGKEHALAVGSMAMSTEDLRKKRKGVSITVHHHLDDALWHTPKFD